MHAARPRGDARVGGIGSVQDIYCTIVEYVELDRTGVDAIYSIGLQVRDRDKERDNRHVLYK